MRGPAGQQDQGVRRTHVEPVVAEPADCVSTPLCGFDWKYLGGLMGMGGYRSKTWKDKYGVEHLVMHFNVTTLHYTTLLYALFFSSCFVLRPVVDH